MESGRIQRLRGQRRRNVRGFTMSRTATATATATAHANIAFSKYWGKRAYPGNYPAVPSLSLTLDAMTTRTSVTFDDALTEDRLTLGGQEQSGRPLERVKGLLDRVRAAAKTTTFAEVTSHNDFPTASGLASSASGFAALALAAVNACGLDWDLGRVSDLARRSSASAGRSLYGGFVELDAGPTEPTDAALAARTLVPAGDLDWRLLVVALGDAKKDVSSSDGMVRTAAESPYYPAWLEVGPRLHAEVRAALLARDFERFGTAAEKSALAMHASAFAAGVIYWQAPTLEVLAAVRALRARGTAVFATMDAGPHVKVMVRPEDSALAGTWLRAVPGVGRVFEAKGAEGARLEGSAAGANP
jgi:diphosphomevalonate decarboxylase